MGGSRFPVGNHHWCRPAPPPSRTFSLRKGRNAEGRFGKSAGRWDLSCL